MFSIFSFIFLVFATSSAQSQIVCPQAITINQGLKGKLPTSTATGLVSVPYNFNCTYQFFIPNQYALKLLISTDYNYQTDTITYTDNLGFNVRLGTPIQNVPQWAVQPSAHLQVENKSNKTRFYLTYEYVDLNTYQSNLQKTGTYRNLNFNKNLYYTFYSVLNDTASLTLAIKSTSFNFVATNYFIFDGDNLINSKMIGKLSQFGTRTIYSSNRAISIVNFYGTSDTSVILANDRSVIRYYGSYDVILVGAGLPFVNRLTDLSPNGGLYTFICDECTDIYLNYLVFNSSISSPNGHIDIYPLSPTDRRQTLLSYGASTKMNVFPQLIPSGMFTLVVNNSIVDISLDSTSAAAWVQPYNGRVATIFAPKIWDPSFPAIQSYRFSYDNQTYSFTCNFKQHNFSMEDDSLNIKIGSNTDKNAAFDRMSV